MKDLGSQKRQQPSLARKVSCWNRFTDKHIGRQESVEDAIRGLEATMRDTALDHPDMGTHECLARAVAASNASEDVRGNSPLQHALGRAPDLDGRLYTPEYEALPAVQAELVD